MTTNALNQNTPEEKSFDLVVAGGGLAGLCAAIAAARHGVAVALIQDRPVFGGNSSSEIRVVPYGCSHSHVWANETGIIHDILLEDRAANHEHFFDHGMMNSLYDMSLSEAVRREPNITVFLNTTIRGAVVEAAGGHGPTGARRIIAAMGSQLGSEREFLFKARHFIDATGDGTLGFHAGAEYRYGREARSEFGEALAPLQADDTTLGSTITMRARDIGHPVSYAAPPWIEKYTSLEQIGVDRKLYHLNKPVYGGYWWLEVNNPFHQIRDNQEIRAELHRHVLGVWNYIKNHSEHQNAARNYVLEWIGQIPGKRESRRFLGDVIVTEQDCHLDREWPDGVAYAGWWIDLHQQGGILNHAEPGERENVDDHYKHWIRVPPFSLPLRAYYSRNVENLWLAGRVMSVSHVALGPVRVQLSLAAAGQAVGTAAAYALKNSLTPRQTADPNETHITAVRQQLLKDDVRLLGLRNEDSADLALSATASATSEAILHLGEPQPDTAKKWVSLNRDYAQVIPLTHSKVDEVSCFLKNESDVPVTVPLELHQMRRIWDRVGEKLVAGTTLTIAPRFAGWCPAFLGAAVEPDQPHRIVLRRTPHISWVGTNAFPVGTVSQYLYECPGGCEPKNAHYDSLKVHECEIPPYSHWRQIGRFTLAVKLTPTPRPYGAANVNNGCAWPEGMPNLWISDPAKSLPQVLTLFFAQPVTFNTVLISFDTGLQHTVNDRTPFHRSSECVRHWRLQVRKGDTELIIHEEKDNFLRRRRIQFDPQTADRIQLHILSTNGVETARVYEIRVYNE
jgi:hypothetical protein